METENAVRKMEGEGGSARSTDVGCPLVVETDLVAGTDVVAGGSGGAGDEVTVGLSRSRARGAVSVTAAYRPASAA